MQDDLIRNFLFDDRIESYSPFYDHEWATQMSDLATPAKKLDGLVFDLLISWKGISRAFSLPKICVDGIMSFYNEHRLGSLENSDLVRIVKFIAERLDQKIVFAGVQQSELKKVLLIRIGQTKDRSGGRFLSGLEVCLKSNLSSS